MRTISEDALPEVVREILRSRPHACYPVIDSGGVCCGMASSIDLLSEQGGTVAAAMRSAVLVTPSTPALEVLRALRQARPQARERAMQTSAPSPRDVLEPVVGRMSGW